MASVFIRHRVRDYATWKAVFDEGTEARRAQGVIAHSVHRDAADPNLVIIALRVQDLARIQERSQSENLRETMARGGVEGTPEVWFSEDVEEKRY
jgi:hypothetical protein